MLSFTFQTSAKDSSIFTIVLHRELRGKTLGKRRRAFLSMFLDDSDMHPVHFSLFCLRFEESFELGKNGTNDRWHISVNRTIVRLVTLYYSSNDYSYKGTSRIQAVDNQHVWQIIFFTTNFFPPMIMHRMTDTTMLLTLNTLLVSSAWIVITQADYWVI